MGGEQHQSDDELIAFNLRLLREQAGMSQSALAAAMQEREHPWHQSTVTRVERGTQQLKAAELVALAGILDVGLDRFTWTSPEAVAADFIDRTGLELRQSARAVANAVADLLAAIAVTERALAAHAGSPYPRVQEARKTVTEQMDLYDVDGAVAEGKRRYEERLSADAEKETR